MGGATVPTPGGGVGAMAFPSAAEPNPIMKGLRGAGSEQIINQITPPQAPATPPATPAAPTAPSTPSPFTGAELFQYTNPAGPQYNPILYSLQGGIGQGIPGSGSSTLGGGQITPAELAAYGYTDISQVPQIPFNQQGLFSNMSNNLFGIPQQSPASFSYNTQASPFLNYKPAFNIAPGAVYNQSPQQIGSPTLYNYLPSNAYNQQTGGLSSSWASQNMKPFGT
jgi:hypothetical protein